MVANPRWQFLAGATTSLSRLVQSSHNPQPLPCPATCLSSFELALTWTIALEQGAPGVSPPLAIGPPASDRGPPSGVCGDERCHLSIQRIPTKKLLQAVHHCKVLRIHGTMYSSSYRVGALLTWVFGSMVVLGEENSCFSPVLFRLPRPTTREQPFSTTRTILSS